MGETKVLTGKPVQLPFCPSHVNWSGFEPGLQQGLDGSIGKR